MEALSDNARAILQAASAFPEGFELDVVAAIAGVTDARALDALDEALASGFLRRVEPPAPPYAFAHAIVRHAIGDARSPDRTARLHRRAAQVMAQLRPGAPAAAVDQWWRSRALAGAEAGVPVGLAAADEATRAHAHRQAAHLLALTLDLLPEDDPAQRAEMLCRLAVAAARALDAEQAPAAVAQALRLLDPVSGADLVVEVADALREGAPATAWEPLVAVALDALPERTGLTWARLVTSIDPVETVTSGNLRTGRWTGYPAHAVTLLATSSREDDQARAIEPFRPRTPAETDAVVIRARSWTSARARGRALDFAGRDYSLRHGRPLKAVACYRDLLALGERIGSVAAQAEACAQLGLCLGLVGEFEEAREKIDRARRLVDDLWPGHRLHLLGTVSSRVIVSYAFGDAPSADLLDGLLRWVGLPFAGRAPWTVVFGALLGLMEAVAGDRDAAQAHLRDVAGLLEGMTPADHAVGGSLYFTAAAAWELGDVDLAGRLAVLVKRHRRAGHSPGPTGSTAHTQARLGTLLGESDTTRWWSEARADAEASGARPLRLLVDYDEASAAGDISAVAALVPVLAAAGMGGWAARAAAGRPSGGVQPGRAPLPAGLTRREAEVLRLLAKGRTSKEIASQLMLSVLTVNRHVANIYAKIGARNRAEATAYAHARHLVG
jgi:DNA-binding CsgD family transcriptional regulator/tetratricopeptide (TPR) repeat protein